jgi:prevent-host-death family protein
MATWRLTEARAKFEDVLEKAHDEGPQIITRYGKPTAVIVSSEEYEKMRRWKQVEESTDE